MEGLFFHNFFFCLKVPGLERKYNICKGNICMCFLLNSTGYRDIPRNKALKIFKL